ncbi:hypothetical protein BD410DRAFT_799878 [Rickenella mellea]|uniref:Uncharacterized protein n=1 Tax=Rickenella mellea TaxID=50990 RepID=A0A4Y7QJ26_9AGAM|nr:hypothetical protein BD410DRAFT_799878 [Rickenella mellea]
MAGRKRAANESGSPTRAAKAAKTDNGDTTTKARGRGGKRGSKSAIAPSAFKAKALPLHINITHTPPAITTDETAPAASADPGFIGSIALVPSDFSTGSYGWKGNKRVTVELQNTESGEKETVQVMISINATVVGSKGAKETDEDGEKADGEDRR